MGEYSVFVDIGDQLKALLETPPIDNVGPVTQDKQTPLFAEKSYAINIKLDKANGSRGGVAGSPNDWATDFEIECYARATGTDRPTVVVDPLLRAVWQRLSTASATDELIALAVQDVLPDPRIEWDLGVGGNGAQICATVSVRIVHRTQPGSLQAWGS